MKRKAGRPLLNAFALPSFLFALASLAATFAAAEERGAIADLKANLDLPFDASAGEDEEESDAPDIIVFYGQQYEGDGIFFCCDRSGSMEGRKFQRLQREVLRNISQFSERVQFGIVFFNLRVQKFPESGSPAEANPALKAAAASWVRSARTGSSSCYKEALLTTLDLSRRSTAKRKAIIVLGDGVMSCAGQDSDEYGEETLAAIATRNVEQVKINTICIGLPGRVNEDWMRRLASQNHGSYARIVE